MKDTLKKGWTYKDGVFYYRGKARYMCSGGGSGGAGYTGGTTSYGLPSYSTGTRVGSSSPGYSGGGGSWGNLALGLGFSPAGVSSFRLGTDLGLNLGGMDLSGLGSSPSNIASGGVLGASQGLASQGWKLSGPLFGPAPGSLVSPQGVSYSPAQAQAMFGLGSEPLGAESLLGADRGGYGVLSDASLAASLQTAYKSGLFGQVQAGWQPTALGVEGVTEKGFAPSPIAAEKKETGLPKWYLGENWMGVDWKALEEGREPAPPSFELPGLREALGLTPAGTTPAAPPAVPSNIVLEQLKQGKPVLFDLDGEGVWNYTKAEAMKNFDAMSSEEQLAGLVRNAQLHVKAGHISPEEFGSLFSPTDVALAESIYGLSSNLVGFGSGYNTALGRALTGQSGQMYSVSQAQLSGAVPRGTGSLADWARQVRVYSGLGSALAGQGGDTPWTIGVNLMPQYQAAVAMAYGVTVDVNSDPGGWYGQVVGLNKAYGYKPWESEKLMAEYPGLNRQLAEIATGQDTGESIIAPRLAALAGQALAFGDQVVYTDEDGKSYTGNQLSSYYMATADQWIKQAYVDDSRAAGAWLPYGAWLEGHITSDRTPAENQFWLNTAKPAWALAFINEFGSFPKSMAALGYKDEQGNWVTGYKDDKGNWVDSPYQIAVGEARTPENIARETYRARLMQEAENILSGKFDRPVGVGMTQKYDTLGLYTPPEPAAGRIGAPWATQLGEAYGWGTPTGEGSWVAWQKAQGYPEAADVSATMPQSVQEAKERAWIDQGFKKVPETGHWVKEPLPPLNPLQMLMMSPKEIADYEADRTAAGYLAKPGEEPAKPYGTVGKFGPPPKAEVPAVEKSKEGVVQPASAIANVNVVGGSVTVAPLGKDIASVDFMVCAGGLCGVKLAADKKGGKWVIAGDTTKGDFGLTVILNKKDGSQEIITGAVIDGKFVEGQDAYDKTVGVTPPSWVPTTTPETSAAPTTKTTQMRLGVLQPDAGGFYTQEKGGVLVDVQMKAEAGSVYITYPLLDYWTGEQKGWATHVYREFPEGESIKNIWSIVDYVGSAPFDMSGGEAPPSRSGVKIENATKPEAERVLGEAKTLYQSVYGEGGKLYAAGFPSVPVVTLNVSNALGGSIPATVYVSGDVLRITTPAGGKTVNEVFLRYDTLSGKYTAYGKTPTKGYT